MSRPLVLVSHLLCPYVQRVAVMLSEKGIPFERRDIDLANKPDWFLRLSPLGKTPVLLVGDEPIFESAVICEYLDEAMLPKLHPADLLQRARHRAWIEVASQFLNQIGGFYNAADDEALARQAEQIALRIRQLEAALGEGPYFAGPDFSMVDAAFGPVFRYFDVFDRLGDFGFWRDVPRVRRWRAAVQARPSVVAAAAPDYAGRLLRFIERRGSALSRLAEQARRPPEPSSLHETA